MQKNLEPVLAEFLRKYNAVDVTHESTCYKSMNNPSYIDLIITNSLIVFNVCQLSAQGYLTFINV